MKNIKVVNNVHIVPGGLWNFLVNSFKNPRSLRYQIIRGGWNLMKLHAATHVRNIGIQEIKAVDGINLNLTVDSYDRAVLSAIVRAVQTKTFFEIGTYIGETTFAVARNNPQAKIYTLDLPSPES